MREVTRAFNGRTPLSPLAKGTPQARGSLDPVQAPARSCYRATRDSASARHRRGADRRRTASVRGLRERRVACRVEPRRRVEAPSSSDGALAPSVGGATPLGRGAAAFFFPPPA